MALVQPTMKQTAETEEHSVSGQQSGVVFHVIRQMISTEDINLILLIFCVSSCYILLI